MIIRLGLAGLAGFVHAASFAPIGLWWLQTISLAALVGLVASAPTGARRVHDAMLGLAFGFTWFLAGVSWLFISMHRYGGMPAALALTALALFALYLGGYAAASVAAAGPWLRAASTRPIRSLGSALAACLAFAAFWGTGESLRGWMLTGFPWLSSGYAHVDGPLAGFAPLVGVHGVGALAALVAAAGVLAWRTRQQLRSALSVLAVAALTLAAGAVLRAVDWGLDHGEPLSVRLVQGNVAQQMKFEPDTALASMRDYARAIAQSRADLVVLPETAWIVPWSRTPMEIAGPIVSALRDSGATAAIGMPLPATTRDGQPTISNSVAAIDGAALPGSAPRWRYDKRHLVPFGEFVPLGFDWFVRMMEIPLGDFGRGPLRQPDLIVRGQRLAFDICYEDLFGEELAVQVRDGATILVNVSNIGWFGRSHALPQHLQIARMRAIELARPILRATNTGMTASIDRRGRVQAVLPATQAGMLDTSVRGASGLTPYARAGALAPIGLLALLAALGGTLRWVCSGPPAHRTNDTRASSSRPPR